MKKNNILQQPPLWEKISGLIFGVVFVSVILVLNVFIKNPTPSQYETFKAVLALAAAGVGGILTGFIRIEGTINKVVIRAGGALALFLIIYFFSPSPPVTINQTQKGNRNTQVISNTGIMNIDNRQGDTTKGKANEN